MKSPSPSPLVSRPRVSRLRIPRLRIQRLRAQRPRVQRQRVQPGSGPDPRNRHVRQKRPGFRPIPAARGQRCGQAPLQLGQLPVILVVDAHGDRAGPPARQRQQPAEREAQRAAPCARRATAGADRLDLGAGDRAQEAQRHVQPVNPNRSQRTDLAQR